MAATLESLFDSQQQLIGQTLDRATLLSNRISDNGFPSLSNPSLNYTVTDPNLQAPPSFGSILPGDTTGSTIAFLDDQIDKNIEKYFPELNKCFRDTPETWCCGIIQGETPLGLSQEAFEQAWHQGRDREYRQRNAEVSQITQRFSASGFSLPLGAMSSAIIQAEQRASDAIGDVNRAQTIRDIELKWEMLKFAEETAVRLKLGMMGIVADMYRFFLDVPNRDIQVFEAKARAFQASQAALANYYQVELGFEQLRLSAEEVRTGIKLGVDRNKIAAAQGKNSSSALASAANGFTNTAAAAANAQSGLIADLDGGA
jgi:hypothetical protein